MTAPRAFIVQTSLRQASLDLQVPVYEQPGPISYALHVDTMTRSLDDGIRHVVVTAIEAVGKSAEGRVVLTAEVRHEMLVHIEGVPDETRQELVSGYFPSQNFPYARDALSQLTLKSGYAAAIAPPLLYQRKLSPAESQENSAEAALEHTDEQAT